MSTRAASAVSSRRAKQELVKLMYGPQYSRGGPEAHRRLDASAYSYEDLKKEYLRQLQSLHPDKIQHNTSNLVEAEIQKNKFVELQSAWDSYSEVAKMLQKVGDGGKADFTMFGVGCSFADTPEERAKREEITEQACRGWFSAGSLPDSSDSNVQGVSKRPTSLCDDDLFVESDLDHEESMSRPKKSLVMFAPVRKL